MYIYIYVFIYVYIYMCQYIGMYIYIDICIYIYAYIYIYRHIFAQVKTGGESLELHLAPQPAPRLDYSACRKAAVRFQGGDGACLTRWFPRIVGRLNMVKPC
jgi:hypothetical protein